MNSLNMKLSFFFSATESSGRVKSLLMCRLIRGLNWLDRGPSHLQGWSLADSTRGTFFFTKNCANSITPSEDHPAPAHSRLFHKSFPSPTSSHLSRPSSTNFPNFHRSFGEESSIDHQGTEAERLSSCLKRIVFDGSKLSA